MAKIKTPSVPKLQNLQEELTILQARVTEVMRLNQTQREKLIQQDLMLISLREQVALLKKP